MDLGARRVHSRPPVSGTLARGCWLAAPGGCRRRLSAADGPCTTAGLDRVALARGAGGSVHRGRFGHADPHRRQLVPARGANQVPSQRPVSVEYEPP